MKKLKYNKISIKMFIPRKMLQDNKSLFLNVNNNTNSHKIKSHKIIKWK